MVGPPRPGGTGLPCHGTACQEISQNAVARCLCASVFLSGGKSAFAWFTGKMNWVRALTSASLRPRSSCWRRSTWQKV